ncbi:MAG: CBS domain-containing protein [Sutterellaceae bacterium]|nr:CBS domain-containing protein [Sutterellaceae bacterium]MDD7442016.1 transporter associated domain-containing protein [Sutterellaceae bacterium]MDY2869178.1 transporter associated domain-containing protein [Mesosutterella sp.]
MTSDQPSPEKDSDSGFFHKFARALFHEEKSDAHADFAAALRAARKNGILTDDSLSMIEGVLKVSELSASEIMVPRSQIKAIDCTKPRDEWIAEATASGHSRFPVIDGDFSQVKGLLHAKDILNALLSQDFRLEEHLREAKFIPETMPLNLLLTEFKREHQHLALVVDEFGEVTGLLTIEDVLEQIVGDIDDEFDTVDTEAGNIVSLSRGKWSVRAITHLTQFNQYFGASLSDPHCETIGGIISDRLERVPKCGDKIEAAGFRFCVTDADDRQAKTISVERIPRTAPKADASSGGR